MKTSKFKYRVYIWDSEDDFPYSRVVDTVTLAEARLVAIRSFGAKIECIGAIEYRKGLEIDT